MKALTLSKEIGDKNGEAGVHESLGNLFQLIGDNEKAREYLEAALTITKEIGDKNRESSIYGNIGTVLGSLGKYACRGGGIS